MRRRVAPLAAPLLLLAPAPRHVAAGSAATAFAAFKERFGRRYTTAEEEAHRLGVFSDNLARVAEMGNPALGVTRFMDLTRAEFSATYLHPRDSVEEAEDAARTAAMPEWGGECTTCDRFPEMANYTSDSLDWSKKGAVTAVKDQGDCDSCYCFGATGDMEGSWFMSGHPLTSLSEQELLSCVGVYNGTKKGCQGGTRSKVFKWVIDTGGITTEKNYPYNEATGKCKTAKTTPVAAKFDSYQVVSSKPDGEDRMMEALKKLGPISVGVSGSHMEFYDSGIDTPNSCNTKHDHAPLLVGYGTSPKGVDYWKLKNSWGDYWGENGYIRVVRGKNWCGIATEVLHMTVGGGKRYHCDATTGQCAEADEGHSTMKGCEAACSVAPPSAPSFECAVVPAGGAQCSRVKHGGTFPTNKACKAVCGKVTPAPPGALRYHCNNVTYQCTAGDAGHSTLEKCETACLAPGYVCNQTSSQCYGVPTGGDKKRVCEGACVYPTPAPAPTPPPRPAVCGDCQFCLKKNGKCKANFDKAGCAAMKNPGTWCGGP